MSAGPARVLVITPVHNEAEHLEEVVAACSPRPGAPDLWLIVDDNSDDQSAGSPHGR